MAQNGYFSSTDTVQSLYSAFTLGSIVFQGPNALAQNNANLFWDNTNLRLGIGTNTPNSQLQIVGSAGGNVSGSIQNTDAVNTNSTSWSVLNDANNQGTLTIFGSTFSATYLQNVTRVSGTNALWLASDVNNASGGTDPIVFSVGGYNNITAQATTNGITAINLTDTGIPASAAGAPLTISSGQVITYGLTNSQVTSSSALSVSTTAGVLGGATVTPAAGTYLVMFSGNITASSAGGNTLNIEVLVGGTAQPDTLRQATPTGTGAFAAFQFMSVATNKIVAVNGSQAIAIQAQTTAGTVTVTGFDFSVVRIA